MFVYVSTTTPRSARAGDFSLARFLTAVISAISAVRSVVMRTDTGDRGGQWLLLLYLAIRQRPVGAIQRCLYVRLTAVALSYHHEERATT